MQFFPYLAKLQIKINQNYLLGLEMCAQTETKFLQHN